MNTFILVITIIFVSLPNPITDWYKRYYIKLDKKLRRKHYEALDTFRLTHNKHDY